MAKLGVKEIQSVALQIISSHPGGIRYSDLINEILVSSPETPKNTVVGSVWNLQTAYPSQVRKPSRGLYRPISSKEPKEAAKPVKVKEEDFYDSFGDWLKNELEEVTDVVAFGGSGFRAKWGTPDVLGV